MAKVSMTSHRYNLDLVVRIEATPETNAAWAGIARIAKDPSVLVTVLRAAMIATLLKAYKRRFEAKESTMRDLIQADRKAGVTEAERRFMAQNISADGLMSKEAYQKWYDTFGSQEAQDRAQLQGQYSREQRPAKGNEEFQGKAMLGADNTGTGGDFPKQRHPKGHPLDGKTGLFRSRMQQFLSMLTDSNRIKVHKNKSGITLGILPLKEADALKTPQSTVSNPVQSFGILWRQLEFGTGMYARKVNSPIGGFRATSAAGTKDPELPGAWWFGRRATLGKSPSGLRLKGSRPGNFLRDQSGFAYDADAVAFGGEFQALLARAIHGA